MEGLGSVLSLQGLGSLGLGSLGSGSLGLGFLAYLGFSVSGSLCLGFRGWGLRAWGTSTGNTWDYNGDRNWNWANCMYSSCVKRPWTHHRVRI